MKVNSKTICLLSWAVNQRFDYATKTLDTVYSLSLISQYIVVDNKLSLFYSFLFNYFSNSKFNIRKIDF